MYVRRYFNGGAEEIDANRSRETQPIELPATASTTQAHVRDLAELLSEAEPDALAVLTCLGRVIVDLANWTSRLSTLTNRTGSGIRWRQVRRGLTLASWCVQLTTTCVAGINRCIGGQRRLAFELAAQKREFIEDPRMREICERYYDYIAVTVAKKRAVA